ncbi:protein LAZY 1-like [Cucurbita maxima]|uniref:Protein LAZY 1-like n=1 Tax=Cucurbita maxima TaxID=3661 RepID=A0A6J1IZP2_CUCMA|nr:protein LAZY 1-like [Cucurbita maxima]XP_022983544.1 protein LAZY 1-like [Cucurbita maxima]XP_022983546.1 protein LAZY 1-like [Cucurbita maxima]XP_022983547.1 protein LAZY 1-like [Cucurbita maxima]
MKLLGWIHNKFWHGGVELVKDFTIANPCMCLSVQTSVDDEDIYSKPGLGSKTVQLRSHEYEQSSFGVEVNNVLECGDLSNSSEFFHGFLTIGTLGSEPATPTFSLAFENMIELPAEVTEDHLKLINYELEKFLEAETKEDCCDQSPGRTSHASIITLAGKHTEVTEDENDRKTRTCPLQGYLFGSTIELPDKMIDMRKEKPSSVELFQGTIAANESSKVNIEQKEVLVKHSNKSALSFVKKILKKLCTSSHDSTTYDSGDSFSTKKKLQKVLRRFHKKIHPESSTATDECQNSQKYMFDNASFDDNFNNGRVMNDAEDQITYCQEFVSKDEIYYWKTNFGLPLYGVDTNVSSANRGHWIKTDEEYLVLEL